MTVEQTQIHSNSNSNSETPHTNGKPPLVPSTETVQPLSADSGMVSSKDTDTSMTIQNDMEINLYDDLISGDDMLGECDEDCGNDGMNGQVKIGGGLDNVKEDSGDEKVNGDKPVESRDGDVVMSEEFTKERSNQEEEESSDDSSDDWSDDSSDESSSESDTSSSESESESEEEDEDVDMEIKGGKHIKDLTIDSDDEVGGETLKTKNEVAKLPPVEPLDITITPDMTLSKIGTIFAFVEDLVVIQADKKPDIGDYQALDETSVLVFEDRSILGAVFETFGPVSQPLYSVRFNSGEEVKEKLGANAEKGKAVFFVENLSKFVYTASLKALKGSDASNQYDEEVGEEEMEFSDDEAEARHRRALKAKKKGSQSKSQNSNNRGGPPSKRQAVEEPSLDAMDLYTPLQRPSAGQGATSTTPAAVLMRPQQSSSDPRSSTTNLPRRGGKRPQSNRNQHYNRNQNQSQGHQHYPNQLNQFNPMANAGQMMHGMPQGQMYASIPGIQLMGHGRSGYGRPMPGYQPEQMQNQYAGHPPTQFIQHQHLSQPYPQVQHNPYPNQQQYSQQQYSQQHYSQPQYSQQQQQQQQGGSALKTVPTGPQGYANINMSYLPPPQQQQQVAGSRPAAMYAPPVGMGGMYGMMSGQEYAQTQQLLSLVRQLNGGQSGQREGMEMEREE